MNPQNIVLLMLDTFRADKLSCLAPETHLTPEIDKLAKRSIVFQNAISSAPWTLPSHASLFTGLHPFEHNADDQSLYLDEKYPTLAQLLNESGYKTIAICPDNGWVGQATNLTKGFEEVIDKFANPSKPKPWYRKLLWQFLRTIKVDNYLSLPSSSKHSKKTVNKIIELLKTASQPTFIYANIMDTHMPYIPDKKGFMKCELLLNLPQIKELLKNFKEMRANPDTLTAQDLNLLNILYNQCVSSADRNIKPLLDFIKQTTNTMLIITADHGESLGEHNLLNHWLSLYDQLIRVPLLIYPSSEVKQIKIEHQVQQKDLFFTILDIIGYSGNKVQESNIKQKSFISCLNDSKKFPDLTYCEDNNPIMNVNHIRKYNPSFSNKKLESTKKCLRSNQYKYIWYSNGIEELFDLEQDPCEMNNIIHRSEIAEQFRSELSLFCKESATANKQCRFNPDEEIKNKLNDLGYL